MTPRQARSFVTQLLAQSVTQFFMEFSTPLSTGCGISQRDCQCQGNLREDCRDGAVNCGRLSRFSGWNASFEGVPETPNGFPETDGEVEDSLKALSVDGGEALAMREQELGIAENAGEGIIHFVAKDRADVGGELGPRRPRYRQ